MIHLTPKQRVAYLGWAAACERLDNAVKGPLGYPRASENDMRLHFVAVTGALRRVRSAFLTPASPD